MITKLNNNLRLIRLFFSDELSRIMNDSGVLLICVGALIIYPVVYAFVYKNNVLTELPIAVVDLDNTQLSRKATFMLDATSGLDKRVKTSNFEEAKNLFWDGEVNAIILIPKDFEKNIYTRKQTPVQVYADGSYFLMYKQTLSSALQSIGTLSAGIEIKRMIAGGQTTHKSLELRNPLKTNITGLYNPGEGYGSYVMPGLLIIIIQQTLLLGIGILGATRKEQKQFKMGNEIINRDRVLYLLVFGKSLAYVFLYLFTSMFCLYWVNTWFGYPNKNTFIEVATLMIPFLFASAFLGLTLSNLFSKREHAVVFLVFLSPVLLFLSGISWPEQMIPKPLYWVTHLFPSTKMLPAYLRLRSMGVGLENVKYEFIFICIQAIVYFFTAVLSFSLTKKKLSPSLSKKVGASV